MTGDLANYDTHRTAYVVLSMVYLGFASNMQRKDSRVGQKNRVKSKLQSGYTPMTTLPWLRSWKDKLISAETARNFGGWRAVSMAVKV